MHGENYGGNNPLKQLKPPSLRLAQQCEAKVVTGLGGWAQTRSFPSATLLKSDANAYILAYLVFIRPIFQNLRGGIYTRRTQNVLEIRFAPQFCYRYHVNKRGEFVCMRFSLTHGRFDLT